MNQKHHVSPSHAPHTLESLTLEHAQRSIRGSQLAQPLLKRDLASGRLLDLLLVQRS
jgi:hypothetical protein